MMEERTAEFPVAALCAVLEVSRSGYYKWRERRPSRRAQANSLLLEQIRQAHLESRRAYGSPRITQQLRRQRIPFTETARLAEVLPEIDALYVTRMQTEWDTAGESRSMDYSQFSLHPANIGRLKEDAIIMHPLPRGPEIDPAVDDDPRAMYWRQERNGMWMRVAILVKIFRLEDRIASLAA